MKNEHLWEEAVKGINQKTGTRGSSKGRAGKGSIWLELKHTQETKIIKTTARKKYASTSFIYLFHMIAIMMKGPSK